MGCGTCGSSKGGSPSGCGDKGHCTTSGCNRMNTHDWLSDKDIYDPSAYEYVEVSFKQGARKEFFRSSDTKNLLTGDLVVVEANGGYDVGLITLSGELVRLQMKKKNTTEDRITYKVIRKANERDLEKLQEARDLEKQTLVKARVISRTMGLDMKIGDIEYQGDKRKATFFYTADGRIDFRELVRSYAKEFKVKIEMRQIGARQESARIGGIGSCGRELCCSTWLSDFKSVTTTAARYQNIAINQTKLSGQCGRLKCCLNYELDTYMDALSHFPKRADTLQTEIGKAILIKTDIFKGIMYYTIEVERRRGPIVALDKDRVKEIIEMNKRGEKPSDLISSAIVEIATEEPEIEYADVTGEIELPALKRKKSRNSRNKRRSPGDSGSSDSKNTETPSEVKEGSQGRREPNPRNRQNRPDRKPRPNTPNAKPNPNQEANPNASQDAKPSPRQQPKPNPNQQTNQQAKPRPNQKPRPNNPNQKPTQPNDNAVAKQGTDLDNKPKDPNSQSGERTNPNPSKKPFNKRRNNRNRGPKKPE